MNLLALVQGAMNAVPSDLRADVTFTHIAPGTHDAATGTFTSPVTTTVAGRVTQDKANPLRYEALKLTELDVVTLVFVPNIYGDRPALGSTVSWNSKTYAVKSAEPVAPNGVAVLFSVVIAR